MIRRNAVAALATCGALAVGIALGAGPLNDLGHAESGVRAQSVGDSRVLGRRAALDERFVADVGKDLVSRRLAGQRIAILAFPGVAPRVLDGVTSQVRTGGATVTAVVHIRRAMIDPGRKTYVDTLSRRLELRLRGRVNPALDTYPRLGQLLGSAYADKTPASSFDAGQQTAAEALTTGNLVTVSGRTTPATMILVLVGRSADPTTVTSIVHGLGGASHAVVAAGASNSVDLAAMRRQNWGGWFASVDGVETSAGQVATALVLARQISQGGGDFGASGFGGLVPLS